MRFSPRSAASDAVTNLLKYLETKVDAETYKKYEEELANARGNIDELLRIVCGNVYDGLAYGNWPGAVEKMTRG